MTDINRQVAEKVMGRLSIGEEWADKTGRCIHGKFDPAHNISDAELILDKYEDIQITKYEDWTVVIHKNGKVGIAIDKALSMAICRSALNLEAHFNE